MKNFSCVIIVLCAVVKACESFDKIDESAWVDINARDKFFEYSDLTAPAFNLHTNGVNLDVNKYVNSNELTETSTRAQPARRHIHKNYSIKVIDSFLNALTKIVNPNPVVPAENETDKGLDVQFESANAPSFGKNQDYQLIYLGTKWCGAGDIAKNKRDIGYFYLTDSCCRAHDLCPQAIEPKQSNYGLKNTGKFTRSHCDCDNEFYQCLKSVNTLVSKQVGLIYFNVLGPQCFREDHPMSCKKYLRSRCVEYTIDYSKPKQHQWIDNKWF